MERKVRKMSKHHVRPKSRQGGRRRGNLVTLDDKFHQAWHHCFENLTVEETHRFIDLVMKGQDRWTSKQLHMLRQRLMREEDNG